MKKLSLTLLILTALTVLIGCATQAERQLKQMVKAHDVAKDNLNKCINSIVQSPAYARLYKGFIFDVNDPHTVKKLTLKTYVTEQDVKDLFDFSERNTRCQSKGLKDLSKAHPDFVSHFASSYAEWNSAIAMVINKELTIGDYNQRRVNILNREMAGYKQIGQRINSQMNQAHQYEIAQRRIAQQELQKWNYQQQVLTNQQQTLNIQPQPPVLLKFAPLGGSGNRTRTTNCNYSGNTIHCEHY